MLAASEGCVIRLQIYLTTLEMTKSWSAKEATRIAPTPSAASAISNFVGGALASLVTQSVVVPIDVVSQRLMIAGKRDPCIAS